MTELVKRSQLERITIAESLLSSIWEDYDLRGELDTDILQTAVYCQISVNRIVWKLNKMRDEE